MALQAVTVEVAFTTTPFADPSTLTWTNISSDVLGVPQIRRGRSDELAQMQAGSCQIVLDHQSGDFDPDNASSPYYPNVKINVPVRVRTTFSGTTYDLFYGWAEAWEQHFDGNVPTVVLTASDGLKAALAYQIGQGYTEKLVTDYGGTVGSEFDLVWPFQDPNNVNSYENSAAADVDYAGATHPAGIAQTGLQLSGSSSYFRWATNALGARAYWNALDSWFRIDTMPTSGVKCLIFNGNSNNSQVQPNFGLAAFTASQGDSLSAYVVKWPANALSGTVADPTSTSGWTATAGAVSSVSVSSSNALSRIMLSDGSLNYHGATKALSWAATASAALTSPAIAVTASTGYTFRFTLASTAACTVYLDWYDASNTLLSSTTLATFGGAVGLSQRGGTATSPTTAASVKLRITSGFAQTITLAQLILVAGSWDNLPWYKTAPANAQLLLCVAAPAGQHPPGQTAATNGWPCFAMFDAPAAGTWFHLAVDAGKLNVATPYTSTPGVAMPSAWLDGAVVAMWTSQKDPAVTFSTAAAPVVGARSYLNGSTITVDTNYSLACSCDELYIPDAGISSVGSPTAAKALAHYNYGLRRHDFVAAASGTRVGDILDALGWPSSLRSIDTGTVNLLAQKPDGTATGTGLIQDANTAEGGLYFVDGSGTFQFWDQSHTLGASPVLKIGDTATDEVNWEPSPIAILDDTHVYNQVVLTQKVTDTSGASAATVLVSDSTSQDSYGVRSLSLQAPWSSTTDMSTLAAAILADHKQPATRIASIAHEAVSTGKFAYLLPREIGNLIQLTVTPRSNGPAIVKSVYLQGLTIAISPDAWMFTFNLAPTIAGH